jgi:hypothetical protein
MPPISTPAASIIRIVWIIEHYSANGTTAGLGLISVVAWAVSWKSQGREPGALRKWRSVRASADDDRSVDLASGLSLVEGHAIA